jgi:2-oxoglutarate ferredoxin oxidoreductase subunit gamma
MLEEMIVAGFGGQGVLSFGMTLAYAGMIEEKEISWMPSYGPEMRGGTANCITILSDEPISSPIVSLFDTAVVLNQPSMDKFAQRVKPGGFLLYDSSNILQPSQRTDIEIVAIPATNEAIQRKQPKTLNMILLGALLQRKPLVSDKAIMNALQKVLPEKYHHMLEANKEAFQLGKKLMQNKQEVYA